MKPTRHIGNITIGSPFSARIASLVRAHGDPEVHNHNLGSVYFCKLPSKIDQNIEVWKGSHCDWIQIYGRTLNFSHDLQGALPGELQREPRWKQKYLSSEQFHISVQKLGNIPILT